MKKNKIIVIVILILVVLAIVIFAGNRYTTLEDHESNFAVSDTATITKIFIADKNEHEVLLTRTQEGWLIDGKFLANTRLVDILLETIKKLKVKTPVSLVAHDNVVKRMSAIGRKVEVYQTAFRINLFNKLKLFEYEKMARVFYVGDATQDNLGTYMLIEGAERPYIVYIPSFRGYLTERFSPLPNRWRSHVIFNKKLANIKSVQLEFGREPEESFIVEVINARGNYKISALENNRQVESYDTLRLLNFLTSFRDLRYESILNKIMTPVKIDSIVKSPKLYELTLVDQSDNKIQVRMFEKKSVYAKEQGLMLEQIPTDFDRIYGQIEGTNDFVLLQYYVFDKVLHPLSYYEK